VLQIRPGDLVAIERDGLYVLAAILTRQLLFGGHWCFLAHHARHELPKDEADERISPGYNAFVDFIGPKREGRIVRLRRSAEFSSLYGASLLQQPPLEDEKNFRIWQWKDDRRETVEFVRITTSPTKRERHCAHYCCFSADFAWELAARAWTPDQPVWTAAT
jgi:hypothetical protein